MVSRPAVFGFLVLVILWCRVGESHPLDLGYIQFSVADEKVEVTLDLNPRIATQLISDLNLEKPDEKMDRTLFNATLGAAPLLADGMACRWSVPTTKLNLQTIRLSNQAQCAAQAKNFEWSFPFISQPGMAPTFQVLIKTSRDGVEHLYNAERGHEKVTFTLAPSPSFAEFVVMGMKHIGAMPSEWGLPRSFHLPEGIDHILFLVGLCLAGGSFVSLIKTATGFTLGHSLTLALATFGVVHLPARWVESAIALSIAYVAAEDLFVKKIRHRFWIATFFGLVHGFGFAQALSELNLTRAVLASALVGFNLGVELGQLVLLSFFVLVLVALSRSQIFIRLFRAVCAFGVLMAGSFWFLQRAFG